MKTTRNGPRARKERAVAKRFMRMERITTPFLPAAAKLKSLDKQRDQIQRFAEKLQ